LTFNSQAEPVEALTVLPTLELDFRVKVVPKHRKMRKKPKNYFFSGFLEIDKLLTLSSQAEPVEALTVLPTLKLDFVVPFSG